MSLPSLPQPAHDAPDEAWAPWRELWDLRDDTCYVNHGSFGPPPRPVREARQRWQSALDCQPMDFFVRQFEPAWLAARDRLAQFVGTAGENLVFVENATAGMNVVANTFRLGPQDEVLLTDHEYGAVFRIWRRACAAAGAPEPVVGYLPLEIESAEQVVEAIFKSATPRTRLLVISHITSPTAIILPVAQLCEEARRRGIAVAIDGPHAPAQVPLDIDSLGCDFYVASLHKWVSAPFGSGFLYVAPRWQTQVVTSQLSWGRVAPRKVETWWDEFVWTGTRDPSPYLASTTAIDLLEQLGLPLFRARTHHLAQYARQSLVELTGLTPRVPDSPDWYGSMASVPLPPGDPGELQQAMWQTHGIEIPVVELSEVRSIRLSCHLYNTRADVDRTVAALAEELRREAR